jgi:hypothetical protein
MARQSTMHARWLLGVLAVAAGVISAVVSHAAGQLSQHHFSSSIDDPTIGYSYRETTEAVSRLASQMVAGAVRPAFEPLPGPGYLSAVLGALDVPIESQILVFTKTGVQGRLTGPANPRALYFNDSVVVGYIRGAPLLELASQDSRQGVIFYTLPQAPAAPATLTRRDQCLSCHQSLATLDVPGMLVRSHFTSPQGATLRNLGSFDVDHRTPFGDRWGGWYVTGTHGEIRHLGNSVVTDTDKPESAVSAATLNVKSLYGRFDPAGYPSAHSDVVALMVFEHQMHAINLMTRLGWEARVAQAAGRFDPASVPLAEAVTELADYLLFVDEAPLTSPIEGTTRFAANFSAKGPRDRRNRSLREFDLRTRLMRYPCSYMIYSAAFDGLPVEARLAVYQRMWRSLSGDVSGFRMSAEDRRAIIEILRDTKNDLPDYFR